MDIIYNQKRSVLKNMLYGITTIQLPVFYQNQPLIQFKLDERNDREKLRADYRHLSRDISAEVQKFEQLR
jgi:hypothetical protein